MTEKTPGQIAYECYYAGFTVTPWSDLEKSVREYCESNAIREGIRFTVR